VAAGREKDLNHGKERLMQRSTMLRTGSVGAVCALIGATAGIAGSSASSTPKPKPRVLMRAFGAGAGFLLKGGLVGETAGPPVHSDAVVPNGKGGFDTVTMDQGSFSSLTGDQLTITEGTKSATYKMVTLTIPGGATVRRNDAQASVSDLKSGDTVVVMQGPKGTVVDANDAQHQQPLALKVEKRGGPGTVQAPSPGAVRVPGPPGPPPGAGEASSESGESGAPTTSGG
jgi:hypothetical protein